MTRTTQKIFALILLVLLVVVPFINWRLGALFWMSAWLVYIFQNMFTRRNWKLMEEDDGGDESEEWSQSEGDKEDEEQQEDVKNEDIQ